MVLLLAPLNLRARQLSCNYRQSARSSVCVKTKEGDARYKMYRFSVSSIHDPTPKTKNQELSTSLPIRNLQPVVGTPSDPSGFDRMWMVGTVKYGMGAYLKPVAFDFQHLKTV